MKKMLVEKEGKQVEINDTLYTEFCHRYGVATANTLILFYEQCRQHGDVWLRGWYDSRTYYRYRNVLVKDGYLRIGSFPLRKGGPVHIPVKG